MQSKKSEVPVGGRGRWRKVSGVILHVYGKLPPWGVWKSMVSLSEPSLPRFNTRTPALIVEYGHKSFTAPRTGDPTSRRRRCSGEMLRAGQGFVGGPTMISIDLTSRGFSKRQYCTYLRHHQQPEMFTTSSGLIMFRGRSKQPKHQNFETVNSILSQIC